jgi:PST family polysaccharide transporter
LVSAVAALVIAYREMPMVLPTFRGVMGVLKEGSSLFLFRGIVGLYTTANVLLIGIIGTPLAVAWFAGAEKICKACLSGLGPITQAFYPHISYLVKQNPADAAKATRLSVYFTVGAGTAAGLFLALFAPAIVPLLLGPKFITAVPILRVMSLLPPLIATSNVFGIQWMVALRMEKVFSWILAAAAVVNIGLAFLLTPRYGALGMAVSMVVAETVVTGGIIVYLRIKHLDPWRIAATAEQELLAA